MAARELRRCWMLILLAACATSSYQPLVVAPPGGLPPDAFERSRQAVMQLWGSLQLADADGFRLQTPWLSCQRGGTPGRRRATIFRDRAGALAVVVEVSWLVEGILGDYRWTAVRGDPEWEGQLADALLRALE